MQTKLKTKTKQTNKQTHQQTNKQTKKNTVKDQRAKNRYVPHAISVQDTCPFWQKLKDKKVKVIVSK